ncbi:MAG: phosphate ABC transporter, permease protein PstA [Planctomycetes bacterium GWF2_50_10]|nr:MAG: phosphate ABC transporter, permease protein PstA [Planctomycetes bacterium GWF2_50_10]
MRLGVRLLINNIFTYFSAISIVLMAGSLLIIIGPMICKGSGAIFFRSTVEFRELQFNMHNRGSKQALDEQKALAESARTPVYEILNHFKQGIDTSSLQTKVRENYRQYGQQLRFQNIDRNKFTEYRNQAKELRDELVAAYESVDVNEIRPHLQKVLDQANNALFQNTPIAEYFQFARDYQQIISTVDLRKRDQYAQELTKVQEQIRLLLGPQPGRGKPALAMDQYGATRMDRAKVVLDELMWTTQWVEIEKGKPLQKKRTPRAEIFAGTEMEKLFSYIEQNLNAMLLPKPAVYWQYLIDDSTPGHFFGGIGPEIIGTLLLTLLAIAFAVPLGIISAAYLVECAGDTITVRIIRICINTLAGVPSIVFGLFGLAFFVLYLFPLAGMQSKPCILAASLTLALLILPVIIRASEEAIKSVPQTYKEASLALGASNFKTFISVTFPAALPGILTGIILSLSRAAGETAPILFTGAVALGPIPRSIFEPTRALSYGSYDIAVGDRIAALVPHQQFGIVTALILLVLGLNICAIAIRWKLAKRFRGT